MKLFVYESLSAGGLGNEPPASLRAEGWAMLAAVAADFASVAEVTTLLSTDHPELPAVRCQRTAHANEPESFLKIVDESEAVLLIAPEFDDILARRADLVLARGKRLLGCQPDGIRATADKYALFQNWQQHGVSTPQTAVATGRLPSEFPVVLKPRDGAGSQATRRIDDATAWDHHYEATVLEMPGRDYLVQTFHSGLACSVAFLIGPKQAIPLIPAEQVLSSDCLFQYRGGRLPLRPAQARRAIDLAARAIDGIDGIDGLAGYVGVDLVLGDGGHDVAIEINPRLTTSYIGLRSLCRDNLAAVWMRTLDGDENIELSWLAGSIAFSTHGAVNAFDMP